VIFIEHQQRLTFFETTQPFLHIDEVAICGMVIANVSCGG